MNGKRRNGKILADRVKELTEAQEKVFREVHCEDTSY
jgi:hypothetical protein